MRNVLIVGLGLMGGAYAYRLSKKGYNVYGCDINEKAITYAKEKGYIIDGGTKPDDYIKKSDIIVLSFYPRNIIDFIKKYNILFNDKQIITDLCGIKSSFVEEATSLAKPAIYCSHHPMAGREKNGIEYSEQVVFEGANFLVTPTSLTPYSTIEVINQLGKDLGFSRFSTMSIHRHDEMIGFTSQLTHAIAVSLVNSDHDSETKRYIGDSYRDLTRIAMINENLWSELFLGNKEYLLAHIKSFEHELDLLKNAIQNEDKKALQELFISATKIRKEMEK